MPCEYKRFSLVPVGWEHVIIVHARCCGYESSSRIPLSAYLRMRQTDEKWYAIVNRGRVPGIKERKRHAVPAVVR